MKKFSIWRIAAMCLLGIAVGLTMAKAVVRMKNPPDCVPYKAQLCRGTVVDGVPYIITYEYDSFWEEYVEIKREPDLGNEDAGAGV